MPRDALKGMWQVRAGVIPNSNMPEHTKVWYYVGTQYEEDVANKDMDAATNFTRMRDEAYEYAKTLTNPGFLNWVTVEWMWM